MTQKRIAIVVGEVSGDILGAGLLKQLKKHYPDAQYIGIGGPRMLEQGFDSLFDMEELSVMGLFEVLGRLCRLLQIRRLLAEQFIAHPPDIFIGIDAPDFNLGLAAKLKVAGIKTVQYVSPTVWAWREKRIFKIAAATNMVLSIFPFEKAFYDRYKVPCEFVGHTLADQLPMQPDVASARKSLGLTQDQKVLALLPGSRGNEVKLLGEPFLQAARILSDKLPSLAVVIPAANQKRREQIEAQISALQMTNVRVVDGQSRQVMTAADAVLLASGTATLEAMLCKKPMVVAYRFSTLTAFILRRMVKKDMFSLPNLLAGEKLVPELLQEQVTAENIVEQLEPILRGESAPMVERFVQIHQQLQCDADAQAAKVISQMMEKSC